MALDAAATFHPFPLTSYCFLFSFVPFISCCSFHSFMEKKKFLKNLFRRKIIMGDKIKMEKRSTILCKALETFPVIATMNDENGLDLIDNITEFFKQMGHNLDAFNNVYVAVDMGAVFFAAAKRRLRSMIDNLNEDIDDYVEQYPSCSTVMNLLMVYGHFKSYQMRLKMLTHVLASSDSDQSNISPSELAKPFQKDPIPIYVEETFYGENAANAESSNYKIYSIVPQEIAEEASRWAEAITSKARYIYYQVNEEDSGQNDKGKINKFEGNTEKDEKAKKEKDICKGNAGKDKKFKGIEVTFEKPDCLKEIDNNLREIEQEPLNLYESVNEFAQSTIYSAKSWVRRFTKTGMIFYEHDVEGISFRKPIEIVNFELMVKKECYNASMF